jgi:hypothetical protein
MYRYEASYEPRTKGYFCKNTPCWFEDTSLPASGGLRTADRMKGEEELRTKSSLKPYIYEKGYEAQKCSILLVWIPLWYTLTFASFESGPLRAIHLSRHKWPGGLVN